MLDTIRRAKEIYTNHGLLEVIIRSIPDFVLIDLGLSPTIQTVRGWAAGDVVEANGLSIYTPDEIVSPYLKGQLLAEWYESAEVELAETHTDPSLDIIELGGGIGFVSCSVNNVLSPGSEQVVVEPNRKLIDVIRTNRALNNSDFELFHAAYSAGSEAVQLSVPDQFWEGSVYREDGADFITARPASVETIKTEFSLSEFALISDIEGAEIELISSELRYLEEHCALLIIEFHDHKEHFSEMYEAFQSVKGQLEQSDFECIDSIDNVNVYRNSNMHYSVSH